MEKKSMRKLSLLGLVLMGASALTAAIVPSKSAAPQANSLNNGTLRPQSADGVLGPQGVVSCVVLPQQILNCHFTAGTVTSGAGNGTLIQTAGNRKYQTVGNTSISDSEDDVDTTSVLALVP